MTVTARSVARANDKSVLALDEIDKSIVRHLQEDGRMSYADLGPAVGLSPATVKREWAMARAWLKRAVEDAPPQ